MRSNRLRELIDTQTSALGTAVTLGDPTLVELTGLAGFDLVVIETEHTVMGLETVVDHLRAAAAHNLGTLVRVESDDSPALHRVLDGGANGVLVPHVSSGDAALRVVSEVRYPPQGHRGSSGGARSAEFGAHGLGGVSELMEWLNANTVLAVMVEDVAGVEAIDEIVGTPGIDLVQIGVNDLCLDMGLAGTKDHPSVAEAVERVIAAGTAAGVRVGLGPDVPAYNRSAEQLREQGVWGLMVASDAAFALGAMRAAIAKHRAAPVAA
jgi:4-hydroxy-2-oxoheptanedioate aldolase